MSRERGKFVDLGVESFGGMYEDERTNAYAVGFIDAIGWVMASFGRTCRLVDSTSEGEMEPFYSLVNQAARRFEAAGSDPKKWCEDKDRHNREVMGIEPIASEPIDGGAN